MAIKRFGLATFLTLGIVLAATASTARAEAAVDRSALGALDLETAQRTALAANPSLAAAEERVRQAAQRVRQARASWMPSVDAGASASHVRLSDTEHAGNLATAQALTANPAATIADPEDYYTAELTATWTLFNGFRRHFENARARYGERQTAAARDEARRLLLASVAQSFYGAQLARENIAIAEAGEAFNQRRLKEARARHQVGTGSLSDVLNFRVQANAARAERIAAEEEYRLARIGLAGLMGLPRVRMPSGLDLAPLEPETEDDLVLPEAAPLIDYALAHRPETRQNRFALKQAEAGVGSARADFLPTVQLAGTLDGSRANSADFDDGDFGDRIGVYFSYNLFAGGLHRAKLAEAKRYRQEAEENLASTEINVVSDVRKALASLSSAREQLALQQANAALVQRNRDLVEKEYAAGQTSLVRLNEAQRNLTQARGRLALARASLRLALSELDASTGKILAPFE